MLTLVKHIANFTVNQTKKALGLEDEETEGNLNNTCLNAEDTDSANKSSKINSTKDDEDYLKCTGKVTLMTDEYILIDNKFHCEIKDLDIKSFRVNDTVNYLAYKTDYGEKIKISKVLSIEDRNVAEEKKKEKALENEIISTIEHYGKVTERFMRNVKVEPNINFSLDNVISDFLPAVGDHVKLECTILKEMTKILEVKKIEPAETVSDKGKITRFDGIKNVGIIDNNITFSKNVCQHGYAPTLGDDVDYSGIKSERKYDSRVYYWRAIKIVPIVKPDKLAPLEENSKAANKNENDSLKYNSMLDITNNLVVELKQNEIKKFEVTVENISNYNKNIKCCLMQNERESLLSPVKPDCWNKNIFLKPKYKYSYIFKCSSKDICQLKEYLVFKFGEFEIIREVDIKVYFNNKKLYIPVNLRVKEDIKLTHTSENEAIVAGDKYYIAPKFIHNKLKTYKVPQNIRETLIRMLNENKTTVEIVDILEKEAPVLGKKLTYENYAEKFHALLYLEEIAGKLNFNSFNIKKCAMRRCQEYLVLDVPGLQEKRPSLIVGDRIFISKNLDSHLDSCTNENKFESFIHKIENNIIFLKFHKTFHENYKGESVIVEFNYSSTAINRCHNAIDLVYKNLDEEILFPKKINLQEPQYKLVESDISSDFERDVPMANGSLNNNFLILQEPLRTKKFSWIDQSLNRFQKEAVKNILEGLARPLPYIIFGPPGTGKTITLCEAVLQLLVTLPSSKLLVATPSNSSANLITEKLVRSGVVTPKKLVRLVANHYLDSSSIPESILSYCATAEISAEHSKSTNVNIKDPRGFTINCTSSVLKRYRIIIGTCSALGILYHMELPKNHFTHVIIDEAGQTTEPEIMIPISLVRPRHSQIILAGDPQQLGPVNFSNYSNHFGLNESYLIRLMQLFPYQKDFEGFTYGYDPRLVTKLLINYRSLPEILELSNELFYDKELKTKIWSEDCEEIQLLKRVSSLLPKKNGVPSSILFVGVDAKNEQDWGSYSWYNVKEATQVYFYLNDFYKLGISPDEIGIITPYDKQVQLIKKLLKDHQLSIPKVGSVEEFQGQEQKIIILSTVRTEKEDEKKNTKQSFRFVFSPQRLNVAITRARSLLVIIGNPKLLQQDYYWSRVLEYCYNNGSYTGCKKFT